MKKYLLFFLSLLVGIFLFAWTIRTEGTYGMIIAFSLFITWQGLSLLFLTFLIALVGTLRWRKILTTLEIAETKRERREDKFAIRSEKPALKVPFSDFLQAYLAGFAIDYLLPMIVFGGEAARAHILKEKHSISWQKGIASGFIDRILELTSVLLLIFPGVIFFFLGIGLPSKNIAIILFSFLFFVGGGIAFFYFKNSKGESILRFFRINHGRALATEKEVFDFFRSKRVFLPLYLSFLKAALLFLRIWLLMFFLGEKMDILGSWPVFSFAWIGTRIPIPADIGFHEAIQVFVFKALGLGVNKGTALAFIIRIAETTISLFGLVLLFKFGLQFLDKILLNKIFKKNEEAKNS